MLKVLTYVWNTIVALRALRDISSTCAMQQLWALTENRASRWGTFHQGGKFLARRLAHQDLNFPLAWVMLHCRVLVMSVIFLAVTELMRLNWACAPEHILWRRAWLGHACFDLGVEVLRENYVVQVSNATLKQEAASSFCNVWKIFDKYDMLVLSILNKP